MQLKDQFNKEKTSHRTVSREGVFDFLLIGKQEPSSELHMSRLLAGKKRTTLIN